MRLVVGVVGAAMLLASVIVALRLDTSEARTVAVAETPTPTPQPFVTADPRNDARAVGTTGRLGTDERYERRHVVVRGLALPIPGVALPTDPQLLPDAARPFRAGWHEGIDFPARVGTPVHAVAAGTIVRIDRVFVDWPAPVRDGALEEARRLGYTPAATLDRIRGRQVWIDHGGGVVTRYAHLSAVAELAVGGAVPAGTVIGAVGSSGYPEGGPHLHLEVRVGTGYLGDGLSGDMLLDAVRRAFE